LTNLNEAGSARWRLRRWRGSITPSRDCGTNWRQKRRKAGGSRPGLEEDAAATSNTVEANRPMRLFEAFVERGGSAGARSAGLTVELPAGARLVVESPVQLRLAAQLLVLLEENTRRSC
jgi:hypothetical protein